jgi:hypothetical protein
MMKKQIKHLLEKIEILQRNENTVSVVSNAETQKVISNQNNLINLLNREDSLFHSLDNIRKKLYHIKKQLEI